MTAGDDRIRGDDEVWTDDDAGPLVRLYTVTDGRTHPTVDLNLLSLVVAAGRLPQAMTPEHARAFELCRTPTTVAEVAAHLKLPVTVTKVLLSDLVDRLAMTKQAARTATDPTDRTLLENLLDGLQRV